MAPNLASARLLSFSSRTAVSGQTAEPPHAAPTPSPSNQDLLARLTKSGHLGHHSLLTAIADQAKSQVRIAEVLLARGLVSQSDLYRALAQLWSLSVLDPEAEQPDLRMIDALGAEACLNLGLLPWRNLGGVSLVLTAYPEEMKRHEDYLTNLFGPITFGLCPFSKIEIVINDLRGRALARTAESKVSEDLSCRNWDRRGAQYLAGLLISIAVLGAVFPYQTYLTALVIVIAGLVPVIALKLLAMIVSLWPRATQGPSGLHIARQPSVSIIVALYRESDIASRLIRRLTRLQYPHDLLDVIFAVEEDDQITRKTLAQTSLPPWIRIAVVPRGKVMTKPRALNFAMTLARGSIIGVYDAEDAPEPDQINKVVQRFHERGPKVACLQGVLDFYNPTSNWLARCFTLEYGGWFRVILPGLDRLGLPIPLGGTTLFFRREALIALGGWDAHNVTEDADLGIRLARRGYRTELIQTTTYEEANCRALPWVKQRSRWIKGYIMTYAVHMRRPHKILADLGLAGFTAFHILFLGSLIQTIFSPILWSMVFVQLFNFGSETQPMLHAIGTVLVPIAIFSELTGLCVLALGLKRSGQPIGYLWIPTLTLYFPMAALASYKALWEAIVQPFYWDKTSHGHLSDAASKPKNAGA